MWSKQEYLDIVSVFLLARCFELVDNSGMACQGGKILEITPPGCIFLLRQGSDDNAVMLR